MRSPRVAAHAFEIKFGLPAKQVFGECGVGVALGDVAGAARHHFYRYGASAGTFEGFHHF